MQYDFADCRLDIKRHELLRDNVAIPIEPQVFDLLHLLVRNVGYLVTQDQMIEDVWKGRVVSDSTLSARINAVRKAVGDNGKDQNIIKTIPRRGFQLVVSVRDSVEPNGAETSGGQTEINGPTNAQRQKVRFATSADGTQIAYATSGSGPPVMRAGHWLTHLELDWHSPVWRPTLDELGRDNTLIRYDQRGTGLSDRDVATLDVKVFAEDMKAVADACGLDRFPIVASSQGAPISIYFATQYPEQVSRMIFWGGFSQGWAVRDGGVNANTPDPFGTLIQGGWGLPESAFIQAFTSLFFPGATGEQIKSMVAMQAASASPEMATRLRAALTHIDVFDLLAKIQVPTLVMHAQNDSVHPLSQGKLLASQIADAEFMMVESFNHVALPQEEAWQDMIKATLEFLHRAD